MLKLIYSSHALSRAVERGIAKLPTDLRDAKAEYQVDGYKTVYSLPNGICLAVIDGQAYVKTVWMKDSASSLRKETKAA